MDFEVGQRFLRSRIPALKDGPDLATVLLDFIYENLHKYDFPIAGLRRTDVYAVCFTFQFATNGMTYRPHPIFSKKQNTLIKYLFGIIWGEVQPKEEKLPLMTFVAHYESTASDSSEVQDFDSELHLNDIAIDSPVELQVDESGSDTLSIPDSPVQESISTEAFSLPRFNVTSCEEICEDSVHTVAEWREYYSLPSDATISVGLDFEFCEELGIWRAVRSSDQVFDPSIFDPDSSFFPFDPGIHDDQS